MTDQTHPVTIGNTIAGLFVIAIVVMAIAWTADWALGTTIVSNIGTGAIIIVGMLVWLGYDPADYPAVPPTDPIAVNMEPVSTIRESVVVDDLLVREALPLRTVTPPPHPDMIPDAFNNLVWMGIAVWLVPKLMFYVGEAVFGYTGMAFGVVPTIIIIGVASAYINQREVPMSYSVVELLGKYFMWFFLPLMVVVGLLAVVLETMTIADWIDLVVVLNFIAGSFFIIYLNQSVLTVSQQFLIEIMISRDYTLVEATNYAKFVGMSPSGRLSECSPSQSRAYYSGVHHWDSTTNVKILERKHNEQRELSLQMDNPDFLPTAYQSRLMTTMKERGYTISEAGQYHAAVGYAPTGTVGEYAGGVNWKTAFDTRVLLWEASPENATILARKSRDQETKSSVSWWDHE